MKDCHRRNDTPLAREECGSCANLTCETYACNFCLSVSFSTFFSNLRGLCRVKECGFPKSFCRAAQVSSRVIRCEDRRAVGEAEAEAEAEAESSKEQEEPLGGGAAATPFHCIHATRENSRDSSKSKLRDSSKSMAGLAHTAMAAAVPTQHFDALFAAPQTNTLALAGRTAILTGASSGIGRAAACALAAHGVHLVLVARRKERLEEIKREIANRKLASNVLIVAGDINSEALYSELRASGCLDQVDTLINNAGLARGVARVGEADLEDWKEMIETNCVGAFRIVNEVLPYMRKRGNGHIISIGSIAGMEPYEGGSVYAASKFALHAFMRTLRYETYPHGIRCTVVAPGLIGEGTEFSEVRFHGDSKRAGAVYDGIQELRATDVAAQIVWALQQPPHVNIDMLHVMPTAQGGSGRIHKS